jgi:hypothetical protein
MSDFSREIIGAKLESIDSSEHNYIGVNTKGLLKTTSVSFVFDRGRLEIENPLTLLKGGHCLPPESVTVSESLKCLVGSTVVHAYISREEIALDFEGDMSVRISLRDDDWRGPQAGHYAPNDGPVIVFD